MPCLTNLNLDIVHAMLHENCISTKLSQKKTNQKQKPILNPIKAKIIPNKSIQYLVPPNLFGGGAS